jgi:hypothetical protein
MPFPASPDRSAEVLAPDASRADVRALLDEPPVGLRLRQELASRGGGARGLAALARDLGVAPLALLKLVHAEKDDSVPLSLIPGLYEVL